MSNASTASKISAYVPSYNNKNNTLATVQSIVGQTISADEILIIDDGSTDGSAESMADSGFTVVKMNGNCGRGAVRKRAMEATKHELVLCCDAGRILCPDFIERALPYFNDTKVVAVYGCTIKKKTGSVWNRWTARHRYFPGRESYSERGRLTTTAAIVRRSAIEHVGGYNPDLRAFEDADLGQRLLDAGAKVIRDPSLTAESVEDITCARLLDREIRWLVPDGYTSSLLMYAKQINFTVKVHLPKDLADRDLPAALLSLFLPHYLHWYLRFFPDRINSIIYSNKKNGPSSLKQQS